MPDKKVLTHEEKIKFMQMAAGICSFGILEKDLDKLVSLYEEIVIKQDQFSVKDAARIIVGVDEREKQRKIQKALDQVSEKVEDKKQ